MNGYVVGATDGHLEDDGVCLAGRADYVALVVHVISNPSSVLYRLILCSFFVRKNS